MPAVTHLMTLADFVCQNFLPTVRRNISTNNQWFEKNLVNFAENPVLLTSKSIWRIAENAFRTVLGKWTD
jgi:hypothetical protein